MKNKCIYFMKRWNVFNAESYLSCWPAHSWLCFLFFSFCSIQCITMPRGELHVSIAHLCYLRMLLFSYFLRTLVPLKHPFIPITPNSLKIFSTSLPNFFQLELSQQFWWVDESHVYSVQQSVSVSWTHFLAIFAYSISTIHFYGPHIQPPKILTSKSRSLNIIPIFTNKYMQTNFSMPQDYLEGLLKQRLLGLSNWALIQ